MVPLYEKLRTEVLADAKDRIDNAMTYAQRQVEGATQWQQEKIKRLSDVTEDYIKRGYLLINNTDWGGFYVGNFHSRTAYIREIAKQMKRPFVFVEHSGHSVKYSFPKAKKYFPLYSMLTLMTNNNLETPERPRVVQYSDITSRVIYRVSYHYSVNRNDILEAWKHEAEHNPEWRKLLKVSQ